MRFYVRSGKLSQEDHIDRLNSIGFDWNVTEGKWKKKLAELKRFKEENGSYDVPAGHSL